VLRTSGVEHEFRTTVVPILLVPGDVERIAAYIGGARKYALQQFRPGDTLDPALGAAKPYPRGAVRGMAESAKQYVRKVVLRGDV
jgi:pyruvate formate lyase activating enzyme